MVVDMIGKSDFYQYHKMVWKAAKSETELYFRSDWKAWVGSVITGIVSGCFAAYFPKLLGEPMPNIIVTIIGILFGTIFGLAIFVIALYVWNGLWVISAKLFRKKEIEANKYTWNDVEISCLELNPDNPPVIALAVLNKKDYEIQKASAKVISITKDWLIEKNKKLPLNLSWFIGKESQGRNEITLPKSDSDGVLLCVANWNARAGYAVLVTGYECEEEYSTGHENPITLEIDSVYRIEIQWFGEIDGHKLDEHITYYKIRFDGEKILFEEKDLNEIQQEKDLSKTKMKTHRINAV